MTADPRDRAVDETRDASRAGIEWLARQEAGDFQLEERLGVILRTGVYASSACLAVGLLLDLTTGLTAVSAWLLTAGLVLLMATPVTRVTASVVEYAVHRDWTFFTLTAIVLLELLAGVVAALVFHRRL
ncbi:MAG TPA: DUF1634 domain-containing protein [Vicinamibacterales bacterium]|nr:DUF1634 domain-containing protein [Vicinamibacterales bacterium]